jgi:hypothetical protein
MSLILVSSKEKGVRLLKLHAFTTERRMAR